MFGRKEQTYNSGEHIISDLFWPILILLSIAKTKNHNHDDFYSRGTIMFTCKTCPAGSNTHTNDYTNRLSCYPCDYDMCRQCVANRWGPEALVFTEDDGRLGFGRSAILERHRCVRAACPKLFVMRLRVRAPSAQSIKKLLTVLTVDH